MAMSQALIVLAMAGTALGSDFEVACSQECQLAEDSAQFVTRHAATEVADVGYEKVLEAGTIYNAATVIGWASYAVQALNVVRDGLNEIAKRRGTRRQGRYEKWSDKITAFVIDPNFLSLVASSCSFYVLQGFYSRLYRGSPMGVFTVDSQSADATGNPVCERFGVIADNAQDALQLGKCHKFPAHVNGCKEVDAGHTEAFFGLRGKCDQGDPVIVQETLFGGRSAMLLQIAFFLGCLLRFFDAATTLWFDTLKIGIWDADEGYSIANYSTTAKKIIRKFAILRGYRKGYIKGLEGGVYDAERYPCKTACCECCTPFPEWLEWMGWWSEALSNMASNSLFAVLTMTSLHISVEDGCLVYNTVMGFSTLMMWTYFFIGVVLLVFSIVSQIVLWHTGKWIFYRLHYWCCSPEQSDSPEQSASQVTIESERPSWLFEIFGWCCYSLGFVSVIGFAVSVFTLFYNGELSAVGCTGIMLEIFAMVGAIAKGFQDYAEELDDEEKKNAEKKEEVTL